MVPKPTFFNLPKEKQIVLIEAVKKEFSRVPLSEALVSNIVTSAKISRGSFYQYFEDKEDAFFFLLDKYSKETNAYFINSLREAEGDLFAAYLDMFHYMLRTFKNKENRDFFSNLFLNMNYKVQEAFTDRLNNDTFHSELINVQDLIDKKHLNVSNENELIQTLEILTAATFQNLIYNFVKELPDEEALMHFKSKLELLKKGLYKGETI